MKAYIICEHYPTGTMMAHCQVYQSMK